MAQLCCTFGPKRTIKVLCSTVVMFFKTALRVDKTISVIETSSGKHSGTILNQPGVIWSVDVSPDGKQAAAVYTSAERFLKINHLIIVGPG